MRVHGRLAIVALFGIAVIVVANSALSRDETPARTAGAPSPEEMAAMMKRCIEAGTPGAMHKNLEPFVGSWKTTTKAWMGPGEPSVSAGTAECQWMLDGRFVNEIHKGSFEMPGPDGKMMKTDFEGHGVTGYDNMKKQYTFGWIDSMSTQLVTGLGTYDPQTKTFTSYGQGDDPATDTRGKTYKYVNRIVDGNKRVFEIHDLSMPANAQKVLEVTYERTK